MGPTIRLTAEELEAEQAYWAMEDVRTLTPDQDEIIAELEHEIERRRAA